MKINVTKRDGSKELFDAEKIHTNLQWAAEDLTGVSISDVLMKSSDQLYDGITTEKIHDITVADAESLISEDKPNYQYFTGKLMIQDLRKKVFDSFEPMRLYDIVKKNVEIGCYDKALMEWYTEDEWAKLGSYIKHDRDFNLTAAAVKQIREKYLIQDRSTKTYYETPQIAFMVMAATGFHRYGTNRLKYVRDMYDAISKAKISLPTPILGGLRSPIKQFSSCVLMDVDDDLQSIVDSAGLMTKYVSKRAGLGINGGRIRAIGSRVGRGEIVHTGVTGYFRQFQEAIKSTSAGGIRDAAATIYAPIWHSEIETMLVLKNNKGTPETRVRRLDYAFQWDTYLIRRALRNQTITLFSPGEVPDLYESFFSKDRSEFETLYEKYEADPTLKHKKTIDARKLLLDYLKEAQETGRTYAFLADHVNTHSPFKKKIYMSNLCLEIALPTEPIYNNVEMNEDETGVATFEGLIQLCTLAAINLGNLNVDDPKDMEQRMNLLVRFLNELLDYQDYQAPQAKRATMRFRPLGIGVNNYAYLLAKNGLKYWDKGSHDLTHRVAEQMYFYALKASVDVAEETGAMPGMSDTIYSDGLTVLDNYCKAVDTLTSEELHEDWDGLKARIAKFGVKNATLLALMPAESSSFVINATNGIEPIRSLVVKKGNKKNAFVQVVPEAIKLKNHYSMLWDMTPDLFDGYIKNAAIFQKFVDQAISTNISYNPDHHLNEKGEVSIKAEVLMNHFVLATKLGLKTRYYTNTKGQEDSSEKPNATVDPLVETVEDESDDGCAGGACRI
jgi:ribonucleoside-diphosphate reductase alpha chain